MILQGVNITTVDCQHPTSTVLSAGSCLHLPSTAMLVHKTTEDLSKSVAKQRRDSTQHGSQLNHVTIHILCHVLYNG